MIEVYKIGKSFYKKDANIVDKNSGYYEYKLICEELKDVVCNKNVIVIINGKFENDTECQTLLQYMKNFDKKIFIASDIIAIDNNDTIIRNCDILLHQAPNHKFKEYNIIQRYSFVPELFYRTIQNASTYKINKLVFGGGVRDNEAKIQDYLNAVPSDAYLKSEQFDNRLEYADYIKMLTKYKYTLVISRKAYSKIGWVTARFVEAIAAGCLPICDIEYDTSGHFDCILVQNADQLKDVINVLNKNINIVITLMSLYRKHFENSRNKFKNLIKEIINEK